MSLVDVEVHPGRVVVHLNLSGTECAKGWHRRHSSRTLTVVHAKAAISHWLRILAVAIVLVGASRPALATAPQGQHAGVAPKPARVTHPVPGLYAGIEHTQPTRGFKVAERITREVTPGTPKDVQRHVSFQLKKNLPGGGSAPAHDVNTKFLPLTKSASISFQGRETFNDEATWPEVSYASLLSLKSAGLRYGGLRELTFRAPVDAEGKHIALARHVAERSGHRVTGVRVDAEQVAGKVTGHTVHLDLEASPAAPPKDWVGQTFDVLHGPMQTGVNVTPAKPGTTSLRGMTTIDYGEDRGHVQRTYFPATKTLRLDEAYLNTFEQGAGGDPRDRIPSWIPHDGVGLLPGKDPTVNWATLRQMKAFDIPYGGLNHVEVPKVANQRSTIDLAPVRSGRITMSAAIRETQTYRYVETFLTQSGHRIVGVEINGVPENKVLASTPTDTLSHYKMTFRVAPLDAHVH
jgi:hypothetical protein